MEGVTCLKPGGAFYVFPNISKLLGKTYNGKEINTDTEFAEYLLEEAKIAVVPGSAFGAEGYIRLSYATSKALIKEGMDRLEKAIANGK